MKKMNKKSNIGRIGIDLVFLLSIAIAAAIISIKSQYDDSIISGYKEIPSAIMKKMDYQDFEAFQSYKFPKDISTQFFFDKKLLGNNDIVHTGRKEDFVNFKVENPVSAEHENDYFNLVFDTTNIGCSLIIQNMNMTQFKYRHARDILVNGESMKEAKNSLMVKSGQKWKGCAPLNKNGSDDKSKIQLVIQTYFDPHK